MIFLKLFYTFFKIGLFSFGGGYGMLSLIQNYVFEKHQWVSVSEFTDIVAVSKMTPGPIGINSVTYVGYTSVINEGYSQTDAVFGSIISSFAVMLPSFILMLMISAFLMKYKNHPLVQTVSSWLRPIVVGLLPAATLSLLNVENFGHFTTDRMQFIVSSALFLFAFLATYKFKINPITVIVLAGAVGGILYSIV